MPNSALLKPAPPFEHGVLAGCSRPAPSAASAMRVPGAAGVLQLRRLRDGLGLELLLLRLLAAIMRRVEQAGQAADRGPCGCSARRTGSPWPAGRSPRCGRCRPCSSTSSGCSRCSRNGKPMSRRYSSSATVSPAGRCGPGWPETKTSSSSLRAVLAPLQVVLDLGRLVVLVDAEEADVEVVARILEVVRVAAEEGDLLLRGEDQADVGVLLEAVEVVLRRPGRA